MIEVGGKNSDEMLGKFPQCIADKALRTGLLSGSFFYIYTAVFFNASNKTVHSLYSDM